MPAKTDWQLAETMIKARGFLGRPSEWQPCAPVTGSKGSGDFRPFSAPGSGFRPGAMLNR